MSSYATPGDLTKFCRAQAFASFDDAQQQAALDAASALADGYLRSRFTLPVVTQSQDLVRAVCNIAAYDLITQRGYNPDAGADDNWRLRYEDALAWLDKVAKGTVSPALADSSTSPPPFVEQLGSSDGVPTVISSPQQRGW